MAMALVYLLVIEVVVCTQPDHHAEALLFHCIGAGIIFQERVRENASFLLFWLGTGQMGSKCVSIY